MPLRVQASAGVTTLTGYIQVKWRQWQWSHLQVANFGKKVSVSAGLTGIFLKWGYCGNFN
jgi:hypothetical protein